MTYPANQGNNNMGPVFNDGTTPVNVSPSPSPAAPPAVPQSPSGSVTGESATYNFDETITSTQNVLENVLDSESSRQGIVAQTVQPSLAGTPPGSQMWSNPNLGPGVNGNKFS
jgi:hypothetical protein